MLFGLFLLFVIWLIWSLFVRGVLFKLILFVFGWIGLYAVLSANYPSMNVVALTIGGNDLSYAAIVPSVICLLALLTTKS